MDLLLAAMVQVLWPNDDYWYFWKCFSSIDIDECAFGDHNCSDTELCINTQGGFICGCNKGYTGNGTMCLGRYIDNDSDIQCQKQPKN